MCLGCILIVCLHLVCFPNPARGEIAASGDVDPADPGTWTSSTWGYIGKSNGGTLNITSDSEVLDYYGFIGYNFGTTGMVTVSGDGAMWTNSSALYVGYGGNGVLNITDGGAVTVERDTWVARNSASSGTIHFDNGTLATGGLGYSPDDLTGTGTINTHGLVSDVDLVFDATHGSNQTFSINDNPGQNITVNLNVDGSGSMGAGFSGVGTMSISDGIVVASTGGYIGYKSGSAGVVTVDGPGSTWENSGSLYVGSKGSGVLNITGGGAVSNNWGYIDSSSGVTGEATVDGIGSTWTNSSDFNVGSFGSGALNITGGGEVSNNNGYIGRRPGSSGVVMVDGSGSIWTSSDGLYIGGDKDSAGGTGELTVGSGGAVEVNNTLRVHNSGTVNLIDGQVTTGSFDNTAGGTFNFTGGSMTIDGGAFYPGTSDFTLDGTGNPMLILINGATMNVDGALTVGGTNTGTLTLDGGTVITGSFNNTTGGVFNWTSGTLRFSDSLTIDSATPFNATGADGDKITASRTLEVANNLTIGGSGTGTLNITGGGTVSSYRSYIGYESGSTGEVTVEGPGATWTNSDDLTVGDAGDGVLNITGGGAVSNISDGFIGRTADSTGTVTVTGLGSTWTNGSDLYVGKDGMGTLSIENGGAVSNIGDGFIGRTADSTGTVTVTGLGSTWTNGSNLYVGKDGMGTLSIENDGAVTVGGNLSINDQSTLDILLASLVNPPLDVAGNATLDGTLNVDLAGSLILNPNDVITLIDLTDISKTISGAFAGLGEGDSVGTFVGGVELFISYGGGDGNDVTLFTVVTPFDGDANRDGVVSADDFASVQGNFNNIGPAGIPGDANGDGLISADDYASVQANFGNTTGMGGVSVPEPATLLLLGAAGAMMLRRRRHPSSDR